jgi:large subunit ribosomal protein L4
VPIRGREQLRQSPGERFQEVGENRGDKKEPGGLASVPSAAPYGREEALPLGRTPGISPIKCPKKARRNALKSVLSDKMRNHRILVVEDIDLKSTKTRDTLTLLKNFQFDKLLIVDKKENSKLILSTRNIPHVKTIDYSEMNIYDSLKYNYIMFSVDAVKQLVEVLKK